MRFTIDRASLTVGSKFIVFPLFYFVFEGNFPSTSPRGAYIWRGDLTEGFLRYRFRGLIYGGAYTWRGLFSEFYGTLREQNDLYKCLVYLLLFNCYLFKIFLLEIHIHGKLWQRLHPIRCVRGRLPQEAAFPLKLNSTHILFVVLLQWVVIFVDM